MRRRWYKMPPEVRRQIIRLSAKGLSQRQILERVDVSQGGVQIALRPLGGEIDPEMLESKGPGLSLEDRVEIRLGIEQQLSLRAIAQALCRAPSTISREVKANTAAGGTTGPWLLTAGRDSEQGDRRPPSWPRVRRCAPG